MGELKVERAAGVAIVHLPLRVDVSNAKSLLDCLKMELGHSPEQVKIDLSATQTLDSTALGVLVEVHKELARDGGRLVLVAPNQAVSRVLSMTRLDRVLSVELRPLGEAASR